MPNARCLLEITCRCREGGSAGRRRLKDQNQQGRREPHQGFGAVEAVRYAREIGAMNGAGPRRVYPRDMGFKRLPHGSYPDPPALSEGKTAFTCETLPALRTAGSFSV